MKRLLSIILAATLLISLVPSAFAVVDAETGLNTLTYNFNCTELGLGGTSFDSADLPGRKTVANITGDAWQILRWTTPTNSGSSSNFSKTNMRYITNKNNLSAILFAIDVEKEGTYKPSISYIETSRGAYLATYVFQDISGFTNTANGVDAQLYSDVTKAEYADNILKTKDKLNYIDTHITTESTGEVHGEEVKTVDYEGTVTFPSGGTYYLVFAAVGASDYAQDSTTGNGKSGKTIIQPVSFTLQEIEVEEPEPEPEPEPDDGSIKYEFNYASIGREDETAPSVTIGSEAASESKGSNWEYVYTDLNTRAIYKTYFKLTASSDEVSGEPLTEGIQLKITVPESGTYTPSVNYQKLARGGHLKIYISDKAIAASDIKENGFSGAYKDLTPLDDKYINASEGSDDWNVCEYDNVMLDAGTHYLTFVIDGTSVDQSVSKWNKPQAHIQNFTLTPVADAPSNNITYCVASNLSDKLQIKTTARGNKINLSAEEKEGYTFRAWVRGSADNGTWVSADPDYSFTAMTNTMLTAIYTENPAEDEKIVEYYNENGEYIATKDVEEEAPTPTKLVGYEFDDWYVGDGIKLALDSITAALTRAVAKHNVENSEYTVSYNGNKTYKYDEPVTLTSSDAVCWLRDGKPVDYGTTYTFYVWDDTSVTTESGDNSPKVMLDTPKGKSRMIEYDEGNGDIVEAGIIFGDSSAITVDSCAEKMISQRLSAHGQFTATSEYSVARGYIICKNINGGLEIIYAD